MKAFKMKRAESLDEMINSFQPTPLDEINLSDFYYGKTMPARIGHACSSPIDDLFEDCTKLSTATAHLLLGHSGCGKSTELINLKHKLKKNNHPVHIFRTELEANLHETSHVDIMLFITEGLCSIVKENTIMLSNALLQEVYDFLKKGLKEFETTAKEVSVDIVHLLKLCAAVKSSLQFETQTRTIIKGKIESRAAEWMIYISEISNNIASEMGGNQPVLIFEDLEKIQPPERAFEVFRLDILAKMPFPVIYTLPISLIYDLRFISLENFYKVRVLPMIKVSNNDKTQSDEGIEVMNKIVELRADLELFDVGVLEYFIKQTGGVLRHLFESIVSASRLASRRGADRITKQDAQYALSDLSSNLSRQITSEDYDILTKIYHDIRYRKRIGNRASLLTQLQALVVLEYQNGDIWHDLHPLIANFLINKNIIERV